MPATSTVSTGPLGFLESRTAPSVLATSTQLSVSVLQLDFLQSWMAVMSPPLVLVDDLVDEPRRFLWAQRCVEHLLGRIRVHGRVLFLVEEQASTAVLQVH